MLPDVDQDSWDQHQNDQFMANADHQISMLDYDHQTNSAIADLGRMAALAQAPTPSDSLTNPIGTGNAQPAEQPEPAQEAAPAAVASDQPAATPVQTTAPIISSSVQPSPSPSPPAPPPDQSQDTGGLGGLLNSVMAAGGDAAHFADQVRSGTGDAMTAAMNAVVKGGGDLEQFVGSLGGSQHAPTTVNAPPAVAGGPLQDYARGAAQRAGIDPDIFVRQIQQESGFNPGARSPAGATGVAQFMPGTAQGMGIDPTDPYASLDAAAQLDAGNLKRYGGDWSKVLAAYNAGPGNVEKYGGVPPFAETQRYVNTILGNQPTPSDALTNPLGTGNAATSTRDISQFGNPQLTNDEAYAACGPAAAVRFAQRFGRNPTLREAVDLAATVGWTSANGMAGLGSEKALMDKMGVPTKLVSGADWGTFANEAMTGNPVTISTQGHYFTADGYDPATNRFHVGRSGMDLRNGSEWMTPEQMTAVMGPVQGGLLADNPQVAAPSVADQDTNPGGWLDRSQAAMASSFNPPADTQQMSRARARGVSAIAPDDGMTMSAASVGTPSPIDQAIDAVGNTAQDLGQPVRDVMGGQQQTQDQSAQPQGVWDKIGSGIADVFKSAFGGGDNTMTPSMQPTPSESLTNPAGTRYQQQPTEPQPSEPGLPVRSLEPTVDANQPPTLSQAIRQGYDDAMQTPVGSAAGATAAALFEPGRALKDLQQVGPALGVPQGADLSAVGDYLLAGKGPIQDAKERAAAGLENLAQGISDAGVPVLSGAGALATRFAEDVVKSKPMAVEWTEGQKTLNDLAAKYGGDPKLGAYDPNLVDRMSDEDRALYDQTLNNMTMMVGGMVGGVGGHGPGGAARPTPGDSANAAVRAVDASLGAVPPGAGPQGNPFQRFVRAWTNRNEAADRFQQGSLRDAGLTDQELLNPDEAYDLSSRLRTLDGGSAASQTIENLLKPAIRAAGDDVDWLQNVLTHQNNVEVADEIGRRVQAEMADIPVDPAIRDALNNANTSLRMRQHALDMELNASVPDSTRVAALRRRVSAAQTVLNRRQADFDAAQQDILNNAAQGGIDARTNRQFSGDLNVADSEQALADMPAEMGPERWNRVQGAANQVYNYVDALRQRMLESGLINQDTYDQWSHDMPHWVPTNILDYVDETVDKPLSGSGQRISLADNGVRQYTVDGTQRFRENPLGALYDLAHQVESRARKNDAVNALVNLDELAAPADRVLQQTDRPALGNENVISRINDGTVERYIAPSDLAAVVNGTQIERAPGFVRNWTNFVRNMATISSPVFALVRNPSMDIPEYLTRELAREGGNPLAIPRILGQLGAGYADAFQGFTHGEFQGQGAQQYRLGGGGSASSVVRSVADRQRAIQALQEGTGIEVQSASDFGRIARDVGSLVPSIAERTEMGPRIASMRLAEQRGATPLRAVMNGRTVTIDFNEGGNFAKTINQFVPFFNVGLQSTAQMARMYRENPRGMVASMMMLAGAPAAAAEAWNRSDPQRSKDYDDVPQYLKDQGVVVMLPGDAPVDKDGNRKPNFYWFNTRGGAPFSTMAREATDRVLSASGNENARVTSAKDLLGQLLSGASPVRASAVGDLPAALTPELIPGLSTGTQLAMNKDVFRGRDIVSKQADEDAPQAAREVAHGLTAAARLVNPQYDIHPSQVDFAVRDMLGGVGTTAEGARELPFVPGAEPQQGSEPQKLPIAGGILKGIGYRGDTGEVGREAREQLLTDSAQRYLQSEGIEYVPSAVGDKIEDLPLLRNEQAQYQLAANRYVDDAIHIVQQRGLLEGKTQDVKTAIVQQAVAEAHDKAAGEVVRSIPYAQMRQRVEAAIAKQQAGTP